MSARVDRLLQEYAALTPDERGEMLRRLAQAAVGKTSDIRSLKGLGREVWRSVDANAYIDAERDSWDPSIA